MRNINRVLAMTLITSITATSVASTRAWAQESGIQYESRNMTLQVPVRTEVQVPVQRYETRVETKIVPKQMTATDIVRNDEADYTCKAYKGMDQEQLRAMYNELRLKHVGTFTSKPAGGVTVGAVAGAALTVVTGGVALIGAAIGGLFGGLFNWFKGGKDDQERDLANRKKDAKYDEETLQLNCMENELKKSQIYAARVPGQMPAGISTSNESKAIASRGSSGYGPAESYPVPAPDRRGNGGSIEGSTSPCGGSYGCQRQTYEPYPSNEQSSGNISRNEAPVVREVPIEDRSVSHSSVSCLY